MDFPKQPNYKAMAEFRYRIRRYLRFSEDAARKAGLEPQQHQLLLAVKGLPEGTKPTITALAERLQIQHHSTVELIDRLVDRGFLTRLRANDDRRQVFVKLTHSGEEILQKLSLYHLQELQSVGPTLVQVLESLIAKASRPDGAEDNIDEPETTRKEKPREDLNHG